MYETIHVEFQIELKRAAKLPENRDIYKAFCSARGRDSLTMIPVAEEFIRTYPKSIFTLEILNELRILYREASYGDEKIHDIENRIVGEFPDSHYAHEIQRRQRIPGPEMNHEGSEK